MARHCNNYNFLKKEKKNTCTENSQQKKIGLLQSAQSWPLTCFFTAATTLHAPHPAGTTHLVFTVQHQNPQLQRLSWHKRVGRSSLCLPPSLFLEAAHHHGVAALHPEMERDVAAFLGTHKEIRLEFWALSAGTRRWLTASLVSR